MLRILAMGKSSTLLFLAREHNQSRIFVRKTRAFFCCEVLRKCCEQEKGNARFFGFFALFSRFFRFFIFGIFCFFKAM
jgi:hypothetical protein